MDKCNRIHLILSQERNGIYCSIKICVDYFLILVNTTSFLCGCLFRLGFGRLQAAVGRTYPFAKEFAYSGSLRAIRHTSVL